MLKKEYNEILKQSLYFIVIVIGLPLVILLLDRAFKWTLTYNQVFFPLYQAGLFTFAVILGVNLFSSEKKQGSMEYLLSLPFSRLKLLWQKILPRLVALSSLLLFYALYLHIVTGGKDTGAYIILPLFYFIFPVFFIFIISMSLSASQENVVSISILVIFIFLLHTFSIFFLPRVMYNFFNSYFTLNKFIYIALSVLLFLVPFTVPFILAFRKFDLHPSQQFNRRYLKVFVPLLLGGFVLSAVIVLNTSQSMKNYNFWYLTSNQKVIESDLDFTRIYDKDKGKIVDLDISFYYGIVDRIESGGYFYTYDYTKNAREYNRINLTTNKVENIYKANRDYFKVSGGGWLYKNTFALFDGSYTRQDISLVLVNLDTRAVIKIKLPDKLQEKYRVMRVFGAVESNGKRSWLVCGEKGIKYPVFRIWEDGSSRELFIKGHLPHYISNILISNANDGMVFYRLNETGVEEIKTDPYGKSVLLFPLEVLESGPRKEVYGQYPGRHGKSLMRIDLEKFTVTKIMDFNGTIIYNNPDECYLLDSHLNPGKVSRVLRDGKLQLLRTFSGYNARAKDNFFQRSRNGIIAKEDGKISIYKFPTLEEIKFKGID